MFKMNVYSNNQNGRFTAEKKLLVVFSYCVVQSSIFLTEFTLSTRNSDNLISGIQIYFLCEQGGIDPDNPCSRDYLVNLYPSISTLSYVLLALFPVVNLIYAINLKELKDFINMLLLKSKKKSSRSSSDTPSTGNSITKMSTMKK